MMISKATKTHLSIIVILAIALLCCILYAVNRTKVIDRIDGSCVRVIRSAAYGAQTDIDRMRDQTLTLEERQEALLELSWNLEMMDHYIALISNYEDIDSLGSIANQFRIPGMWLLGKWDEVGYPVHDSIFADGMIDKQESTILDLLYTDMKEISDAIIITDISDSSPPVTQSQVIRSKELIPLLIEITEQWVIPEAGGTRWDAYEGLPHVTR
ncbi:MAG: hypothetical protein LUG13_07560 [Oscillospiraceae bacterium]|nr:hypothetical protein [Oscillospiraceae bacterium]